MGMGIAGLIVTAFAMIYWLGRYMTNLIFRIGTFEKQQK